MSDTSQNDTIPIVMAKGARAPVYATQGAAGMDAFAHLPDGPVTIRGGGQARIPLGFSVAVPAGFEMQVRSRSGLAHANRVSVTNQPGMIDSDYRGEVAAILRNDGGSDFVVSDGDRIVQLKLASAPRMTFSEVDTLPDTARGAGGFGSTGTVADLITGRTSTLQAPPETLAQTIKDKITQAEEQAGGAPGPTATEAKVDA